MNNPLAHQSSNDRSAPPSSFEMRYEFCFRDRKFFFLEELTLDFRLAPGGGFTVTDVWFEPTRLRFETLQADGLQGLLRAQVLDYFHSPAGQTELFEYAERERS